MDIPRIITDSYISSNLLKLFFQVKWYRETMLVVPNEYRYTEHFGIRHTLVLRKVQREDFGNYSCRAENSLGRSRAFIELSGNKIAIYYIELPYLMLFTGKSKYMSITNVFKFVQILNGRYWITMHAKITWIHFICN